MLPDEGSNLLTNTVGVLQSLSINKSPCSHLFSPPLLSQLPTIGGLKEESGGGWTLNPTTTTNNLAQFLTGAPLPPPFTSYVPSAWSDFSLSPNLDTWY
jgi:hypothetical protein